MLTHKYLRFISRKIKNLRTAIFFDYSPAILKMPASVIRVSDVDESGNIWFTVKKPYRDMSGVESRFFSQLRFYNKMFSYFIIIHGVAIIATDNNALGNRDFVKSIDGQNEIRIRIAISHAEFHRARVKKGAGFIGLAKRFLMGTFWAYPERDPIAARSKTDILYSMRRLIVCGNWSANALRGKVQTTFR
jgi:hypothetical protein